MENSTLTMSYTIHIIWLTVVLAVQVALDLYFTRDILWMRNSAKSAHLGGAGITGMVVLILLLGLVRDPLASWMIEIRNEGNWFALSIVALVGAYALLGLLFSTIKGVLIHYFSLADTPAERKQRWWSYVLIGNVATVLLASPSFFIYILYPVITAPLPMSPSG